LDPKTILTYRTGVDQFVENCAKTYVEDVTKQDMINFTGWLRKQPLPQRRNSNPDRTYANKVGVEFLSNVVRTLGPRALKERANFPL